MAVIKENFTVSVSPNEAIVEQNYLSKYIVRSSIEYFFLWEKYCYDEELFLHCVAFFKMYKA